MDKGRVIGVDIEIRNHNRTAIEPHQLFPLISLIEGSSIDKTTVQQVRALIKPGERVLVILDSNHSKAHVLEELKSYHPFVSSGFSIVVATDGSMKHLRRCSPRTRFLALGQSRSGRSGICGDSSRVRAGATGLALQREQAWQQRDALAGRLASPDLSVTPQESRPVPWASFCLATFRRPGETGRSRPCE